MLPSNAPANEPPNAQHQLRLPTGFSPECSARLICLFLEKPRTDRSAPHCRQLKKSPHRTAVLFSYRIIHHCPPRRYYKNIPISYHNYSRNVRNIARKDARKSLTNRVISLYFLVNVMVGPVGLWSLAGSSPFLLRCFQPLARFSAYRACLRSPVRTSAPFSVRSAKSRVVVAGEAPVIVL